MLFCMSTISKSVNLFSICAVSMIREAKELNHKTYTHKPIPDSEREESKLVRLLEPKEQRDKTRKTHPSPSSTKINHYSVFPNRP